MEYYFFEFSFGKRPQEELYDMKTDPDCVHNLADDPEYSATKTRLWEQLKTELTAQQDPRILGKGDIFDFYPYCRIERQQRLQKQMGHCLWVIELQQKEGLIGFCGIAPFEPPGFLEIGWWLDESCWGQGYATEAAKVVLDYAINVLGITQLRSVSHRDHSRSQAVMRRIGMRHEQDLLLGDFGKEPEDLPVRVHLYDHQTEQGQSNFNKAD